MLRRIFITGLVAGLWAMPVLAAAFVRYDAGAFARSIQAGDTVVVHVHADWCPTCRQQAPTLTQLSTAPEFAAIRFVRVDFDKDQDFLRAQRVSNQSTIIVFKGGREVIRFVNVTDRGELIARVRQATLN
jgi:thiol-disulfide isomerase/thioredoxin